MKYQVKSPLKYGGKYHAIDSSIDLDAQAAKPLLADGVIAKPAEAEPSGFDAAKFLEQPIAKIVDAIAAIDNDNQPRFSIDQLSDLHKAETAGKNRKGVLDALDAEANGRGALT